MSVRREKVTTLLPKLLRIHSSIKVRRHRHGGRDAVPGSDRRRQTAPSPGGLEGKGTKGKRARRVPIIVEIRELVLKRIAATDATDARLFTGPRGGRVSTAVLRDNADPVDELPFRPRRRPSRPDGHGQ